MKYFDKSGFRAGLIAALAVAAMIFLGSRWLRYFDWALTTYAVGSIFAAFAVAYRYAVWAQRPPTKMYVNRGWRLFFAPQAKRRKLGTLLLNNFVLQTFITKRSSQRWIMHACLSWGGMLAFALTFPLVFGWLHFETLPNDAETYRVYLFGFVIEQFPIHSFRGFMHFNLLNIAAVVLIVGLILSVKLRMSDRSELAIQSFADDVFPVLLLFAVAVTGLMLTVSAKSMDGYGFPFIGMAHAASVIALLLFLPFGKLFHIVQRPLSLGVSFYKEAGEKGPRAVCLRCGGDFASQMHVQDLKKVLDQVGFNFRFQTPGGELHYQDICPPCRRRLFALNQGRALGR